MAQLGGSDDGRVGDIHAVVQLVLLLQAAQDGDGRFHAGLFHQDFLETPLQRGVLLDVLAVFIKRRRADAVQFATRQRRLQHVAGIDGTVRLAGTDHGVDFVDEQDDAAFVLRHLLQHRLQAFLELAAVLGAGEQAGHVEHQHLLALQGFRHFLVDDTLRQTFDDGRLADARLADQHRVVLGTALENLDGTADFIVATDHRVEFALSRPFRQVDTVFLQGFTLPFRILIIDPLATAHGKNRCFQRLSLQTMLTRQAPGLPLVFAEGEQEHLAGDELVAALLRLLVGQVEQVGQITPHLHIATVPLDLGQPLQGLLQIPLEHRHIDTGPPQQRYRTSFFLVQERQQQMLRFDELLVVAVGEALRIRQCLLKFGGEFVESHENLLTQSVRMNVR